MTRITDLPVEILQEILHQLFRTCGKQHATAMQHWREIAKQGFVSGMMAERFRKDEFCSTNFHTWLNLSNLDNLFVSVPLFEHAAIDMTFESHWSCTMHNMSFVRDKKDDLKWQKPVKRHICL